MAPKAQAAANRSASISASASVSNQHLNRAELDRKVTGYADERRSLQAQAASRQRTVQIEVSRLQRILDQSHSDAAACELSNLVREAERKGESFAFQRREACRMLQLRGAVLCMVCNRLHDAGVSLCSVLQVCSRTSRRCKTS